MARPGMGRVLAELDLSNEQEDRIWEIVDGLHSEARPLMRDFRDTREEVAKLLGAATIDRTAVETLRAQRVAQIDEASKKLTTALLDAAAVLTPEQRAKFLEEMAERRPAPVIGSPSRQSCGKMSGRMADQVLIIDDDTRLSAMLCGLSLRQWLSESAPRRRRGPASTRSRAARRTAVILDVMLPDLDGFETCRRIRAFSDVPVLMLTAKGEETDRIVGLELGADDYLPKPFNPRELLARLKAILRRRAAAGTCPAHCCAFGRLEIDPGVAHGEDRRRATAPITSYQFDLLVALAENAGRILSRDQLMDMVTRRGTRSLRPLDRRACLAHPRGDRERPEASAPHHHRARRRLCVCPQPGRRVTCGAASSSRSI